LVFFFISVVNTDGGEGGRCNYSHPFPSAQLAYVQIFNEDIVEDQMCSNLFNRVVRSFSVMALVREKVRELYEEKSSKPLVKKISQLSLEINHLCSSTQQVHIILKISK
jgi:hypothetical protein